VALVALGTSWTLFAVQKYPLTFYIYVVFPCYFWREALVTSSGPLLQLYRSGKWQGSMKVLLRAIFVIAALQIMVVRVSILRTLRGTGNLRLTPMNRSDTLTGVSGASDSSPSGLCGQPGTGQEQILEEHPVTCSMWIMLCLTTAVFPMLDVNKSENLGLM
jgi:phosphatidylinositol glycan class N